MTTDPVGVLIAEDQDLLRSSLAELVAGDQRFVLKALARNGREAIDGTVSTRPDVVLMDIRMPDVDGLEATEAIHRRNPATKVVILTTFDLDAYVFRALRAGACGFLLKNSPPDEILRALHAAADGNAMLAPEVTRRLISEFAPRHGGVDAAENRFSALTEREEEVVMAITKGMSNEEIADALFLSRATVKSYLSRLYLKLGVRDRTQLVILAYETGFVDGRT